MAGQTTKSEVIAQEIRRRVLSGEYPRGLWLRQDALAAGFGVSITPVREALRVLESERFLISEPHRGVRVADVIDIESIQTAYVLRRLAETFAVRKALHRLSPLDLDELEDLLQAAEADDNTDGIGPNDANREFHFAFYRRCGLPGLTSAIEQMWAGFPWDLMLSDAERRAESRREHRAILTAARSGSADALVAAFERHLAGGMAAISIQVSGSPGVDPFDVA